MDDTETTLRHLTLNTGHVRRSLRGEVDPAVYRVVGPLLDAVDGRHQRMPDGFTAWDVSFTAVDDALLATLWHRDTGAPALTFGVAATRDASSVVWEQLVAHAAQLGVRVVGERPAAPWLGVVLLPTLGAMPRGAVENVMAWAGDFERCVGWSWLARRGVV